MPETNQNEVTGTEENEAAQTENKMNKIHNYQCYNENLDDLAFYENLLRSAVCNNSEEVFPNSGKDHAAIALSVLFSNTSVSMNLLVNDFNGSVSNNPKYVTALEKCLAKGVSANVITLAEPQKSQGFLVFEKYKNANPSKVKIYQATEDTRAYLKKQINTEVGLGEVFNIGTFDDNKYRLEILPSKYTALISFKNPQKVKRLNEIFETALASSIQK